MRSHRLVGAETRAAALLNVGRDAAGVRNITNVAGDPFPRLMDRILRQIGVPCRRLDVAVAEQLADRRQSLAERQRTGSEGMA